MTSLRSLLFGLPQKLAPKPLAPILFELDGNQITISLKRHASAKRMVLRLSRDGSGFVLTLPKRHSMAAAKDFIETSSGWMRATFAKRQVVVEIAQEQTILLRGEPWLIKATGKPRGLVVLELENKQILVPGSPPHMKRRLLEWLKKQAEADLSAASHHYAGAMQCSFSRLSLRDQKSRWGSCTTDKALSFSWRLILAPPLVLDYVAAHEVAHLKEMNHGPRFWRLVLAHCKNAREAQRWLKLHGTSLHRYT